MYLRSRRLIATPVLGELVYLHIFGQGLVFVNSPEAASDLLDKRGSIYSDKPQFTMVCDL
jgi:hypothetical protein